MKTRRLRLWLITVTAALIVLAATLSALFRTAVAVAPGYRQQLQAWVGKTLDHPARIGSMNLLWHGFQPVLELDDVQLLAAEGGAPIMVASRLRIGIGLRYLLMGHIQPSDLTLSGLQLGLQVDDDGRVHLQGFGARPGQTDYEPVLQALARFDALHLDGCRLTIRDASLDPDALPFDVNRVDLLRQGEVLMLKASLRPPHSLAQTLTVEATTQGPIEDPGQWQVNWSATANGLAADLPWLRRQLADGTRIETQEARLAVGGQWLKGQFTSLNLDFRAEMIEGRHGNRVMALARKVQIAGTALRSGPLWTVAMAPLRFTGLRGDWPDNRWAARLHVGDAGIDEVDVSGDFLRLDDIASWFALAKQSSAVTSALSGEVSDIRLQWRPPDPMDLDIPGQARPQSWYDLTARFASLGLTPEGERPGFAGLSGRLSASTGGGTLEFDPVPMTLTLPSVMEAPVLVDGLSGPLRWQQEPDGWRLSCAAFEFRLGGTSGNGHFEMRLPRVEAQSPTVDLLLDFQSEDAAALKPLMPKNWGPNTKAWLRRAVERAPIPHGHLELRGPLADFPFVKRQTGHWGIDLDVNDAALAFAPDWVPLDHLQASVHIVGHRLDVDVQGATLGGTVVDGARAVIPDFEGEMLEVDGHGHGDATHFYEVLRNSPLKKQLSGLLDHTEAAGSAELGLQLDIPLSGKASEIGAHGDIVLDDVRLDIKGLDEPIRNLGGKLAFGPGGISADPLRARFYELPLSARIVPDSASPEGRVLIDLDAPMSQPEVSGGGVMAHYLPDWILQRLSGQAHWTASLPLSGKGAGVLSLASDLKGVTSRLPPPMKKKVDELRPVSLLIGGDDVTPLRLLIGFPDGHCAEACIALRFVEAQKALRLRGIEGHFGADAVPQAAADGIVVSGHPQTLDIAEWLGLFGGDAIGGALNGVEVPAMRRLDVTADSMVAGDYRVLATHLLIVPAANPGNGWTLNADGEGAKGSITWLPANGGQLRGSFDHLNLEPITESPDNSTAAKIDEEDKGDAFEPARAPTIDLTVDRVESAGIHLGRFRLITSRIANGQAIDTLHLDGGVLTLDSHGSWRRSAGRSSGDNQFTINSEAFGEALKALGYAPNLTGHTAKVSGQLQWPDSPAGLDFRLASGAVQLEVDNGSLTAVNPGAGRMLGLLNLYALPRRLTLNFSDVVSKGLGFDKLQGTFALSGGNALTQDMRIAAPSLRMEIHGRIGLMARDYDEHVTVYPGLSTGAVIGAGLAGGPAGIAIALVAQQLFNKPLETLTRFSYHLSGGWDNPQFKRGDSETVAAPAPSPQSVPASPPPTTAEDKAG